jgi:hypothetical protein
MHPTLILFGIAVLVLVVGIAIARLGAMSNDRFRRADAAVKAFWAAVGRVFSRLFAVVILVSIGIYAWKSLDDYGWISHDQHTSVLIKGGWLQGEFRTCFGNLDHSGKQTFLDCGNSDGTEHIMPVHYWGRIDRPERESVVQGWVSLTTWNCQRGPSQSRVGREIDEDDRTPPRLPRLGA